MGPPSASEGDGVLVSDTLMHGDTGLHLQIVLQYGHIVIITELTVTDIHTGGMIDHPGVIEAHQEEEPLLDTEAGEVGRGVQVLHVAQSATVNDVIVAVLFAVDPQLSHLDTVSPLALRNGGHHLGAEAHQHLDPHWIPSRPREQAKMSQNHLLKVHLGRRAWFHMVMGLQILGKGERM